MANVTDEHKALVERAQRGDYEAFETLVNRYEKRLYGLAFRIVGRQHDAEEVVQQTFLTLVEKIDTFRGESSFKTWLMRIAVNTALQLLRKRKDAIELGDGNQREDSAGVEPPQYIAQWKETPEQLAQRRETRQLIEHALEELDEKYRLVFLLRDVEGLSTAETAEALGISEANVKVRLLRARLMLREKLTRVFGDENTRVVPDHDHEDLEL